MTWFDVIVIGQGLAGTALAWQLRGRGRRVLVLDRDDPAAASRVAAGLVTPITGKRLAKSWRLDTLLPAAELFYRRAEADTGTTFYHQGSMVRLYQNEEERDTVRRKADDLRGLATDPDPPPDPDWFAAPLGGFQTPAARLDVPAFLAASRATFTDAGSFRVEDVQPDDVDVLPDRVRLPRLGVEARGVAFCEGVAGAENPRIAGLRFNPVKGEVLTVRVPGLAETRVVNGGVWLLPLGDNLFRVGATYDRGRLDFVPTDAGRDELVSKLRGFLRLPFEVVDHRAGLRPVIDAGRPSLGSCGPRVWFFNGLGSKGVLVAPHFAGQLADEIAACP